MSKAIRFSENQVRPMAIYLAQLEAEGIAYRAEAGLDGWTITITGY